ncbi:MAG: response regulator transcription factor [Bacteriovoracia bacterium]
MYHILVVEDGADTRLLLKKALSGIAAELHFAETLEAARAELTQIRPHLIILDIELPDGDGLQFCSELQAQGDFTDVAYLFLTGQKSTPQKVAAFAMGAEDFIEKPFNPVELKARVEARLRKLAQRLREEQVLVRGDLTLNATSHRAFLKGPKGEESIALTPREFRLLFYLARHEDHVLTRDQILSAVWGDAAQVFDRTVDTYISNLRRKLKTASSYLEAVPGTGYRFTTT